MDTHADREDFVRLLKMVGSAQDFGLKAHEARFVAEEALERHESISDAREWAAGVLAARVLAPVRRPIGPIAAAAAAPLLACMALIAFSPFALDALIGVTVGYGLGLISADLLTRIRPVEEAGVSVLR
jgi:hypothetical protein